MGRSQRQKGARRERELCAELRRLGFEAERNSMAQSRDGGSDDVLTSMPPYKLEVKGCEKLSLFKELEKARSNGVTALCWKKNRKPWIISLHLEDFANLLQAEDGRRSLLTVDTDTTNAEGGS